MVPFARVNSPIVKVAMVKTRPRRAQARGREVRLLGFLCTAEPELWQQPMLTISDLAPGHGRGLPTRLVSPWSPLYTLRLLGQSIADIR